MPKWDSPASMLMNIELSLTKICLGTTGDSIGMKTTESNRTDESVNFVIAAFDFRCFFEMTEQSQWF
jgi:hypothetical protein